MDKGLEIALLGADGLIGESILSELAQHPSLSGQIQLLGEGDSIGQLVEFEGQELPIGDLADFHFDQVQLVISCGEGLAANDWLESAQDAGCIILDIGAHLQPMSELPPVVASVNPQVLSAVAQGGILTLPDAATVQAVRILKPVMDSVGLARVNIVSCQAVSDNGKAGVEEMARQTAQLLNGKPVSTSRFPKQVAFNILPLVGDLDAEGHASAEVRLADGIKQILNCPDLSLSVTCCWTPVFFGHSQAVQFQTERPIQVTQLGQVLSAGSDVLLSGTSDIPPTAVTEASGKDYLTLGRLRSTGESTTDFSLWTVADNLRFGIAGNTVKLLEVLVKDYL